MRKGYLNALHESVREKPLLRSDQSGREDPRTDRLPNEEGIRGEVRAVVVAQPILANEALGDKSQKWLKGSKVTHK
jgi:hypothetical protein